MRRRFRSFLMGWVLMIAASPAMAQSPLFNPPKNYMLVLGDSLAFGYQRPKFLMTQNPANFNTGFADDFWTRVRATPVGRDTTLVNLGCPNETTTSFLTGPCAFHTVFDLHVNYSGSQMAAAEAGIGANPGQVSPILIAIGANDVFAVSDPCGGLNSDCFKQHLPQLLASLGANYGQILARLRKAAPNAEIITLGLYNPFAVVDPSTNDLVATINQVIQQVAQSNRARFADAFPPFNLSLPQPATLCVLSLVCAFGDIHPSDLGYQVIADIMWEAADYKRFEH